MANFVAELRRRHIYRIGAAYVVVAWGATQVVDVISQVFTPAPLIGQVVLIVLAAGFPITLVVTWLIEGKAQEDIAAAVRSKATSVDWVLAGALLSVLALIGYQQLGAGNVSNVRAGMLANSVAVLPFENLSPDPDNAYFAAGIHESLLNELVKISDMNVISRTSVMRYADGQIPISQIAAELNVETVMEGSVQYADNQVRVTAQLIDPDTGAHLWSENYDRDFSGIFAVQTEIASNIAMALEVELLPGERESIEKQLTESPEAYAAYLKAVNEDDGLSALTFLDEALGLDPEFARAYALKAWLYVAMSRVRVSKEAWLDNKANLDRLASAAANSALALDPTDMLAHLASTFNHALNQRLRLAVVEAALTRYLYPEDPSIIYIYYAVETYFRDELVSEESISQIQHALELDPYNADLKFLLAYNLLLANLYAEARDLIGECDVDTSRSDCLLTLAQVEFSLGDKESALDALDNGFVDDSYDSDYLAQWTWAYGLLGEREFAEELFGDLVEQENYEYVGPLDWAMANIGVGNYDEALQKLNEALENPLLIREPFNAHYVRVNVWSDPMLEQPEWVEARNQLGFGQ